MKTVVPADKHWYARRKAAEKLGMDDLQLNEEPDYIESDIGYDKYIEGEH